ncbi:polyamine transporter tpo5, partial [Teratosphaeriaceae sp. CCFEE 6253]
MPTALPVSAESMNYAIVYLAGILAFSTIYWYIHGRKFYTGPLIESSDEDNASSAADRSSDDDGVNRKTEKYGEV